MARTPRRPDAKKILAEIVNDFSAEGCDGCGTVGAALIGKARRCLGWEPPGKAEVFLTHKGQRIFRAYKDGNINRRLEYWYSTTGELGDGDCEFDVRSLPGYRELEAKGLPQGRLHRQAIKDAIDAGMLAEDRTVPKEWRQG